MKIGVISTIGNNYAWAGSEETWSIFAIYALMQGHSLSLMLPEKVANSKKVEILKDLGASVSPRYDLNALTRRMAVRGQYSRFKSFLSKSYDVLFVSTGGIADCAWIPDLQESLLKINIPVVYFIQSNSEGAVAEEVIRQSLRKLYTSAARIIFLSEQNQSLAARQLAFKLLNSEIIMNPLRVPVLEPLSWPVDKQGSFNFAEVARLEVADKQQDHLLEALSTPVWKGRNWTLTLFGSGQDEYHIRRLINFYGLENKVRLGGFMHDFCDIWKGHHLHILPSRREGMPLSLIESMACGRPAVVTRAGGSPELIDDGINGFISPGMHPEVLRDCLERAWQQRGHWQSMGKAAADKIKTVQLDNWPGKILDILELAAYKNIH